MLFHQCNVCSRLVSYQVEPAASWVLLIHRFHTSRQWMPCSIDDFTAGCYINMPLPGHGRSLLLLLVAGHQPTTYGPSLRLLYSVALLRCLRRRRRSRRDLPSQRRSARWQSRNGTETPFRPSSLLSSRPSVFGRERERKRERMETTRGSELQRNWRRCSYQNCAAPCQLSASAAFNVFSRWVRPLTLLLSVSSSSSSAVVAGFTVGNNIYLCGQIASYCCC